MNLLKPSFFTFLSLLLFTFCIYAQKAPEVNSLMKPKLPAVALVFPKDTLTKKVIASKPKAKASQSTNVALANTHKVTEKETAYGISRKYGMTVDELLKLNNLSNNALKLGQILLVKKGASDTTKIGIVKPAPKPETIRPYIPQSKLTTKRIYETGIAKVIEVPGKTKKLLALHLNAPIGRQIQIKNLANGKYIFAKVIGRNPPGDEKIIVKLSPTAFDFLGAKDGQCAVEVSYDKTR